MKFRHLSLKLEDIKKELHLCEHRSGAASKQELSRLDVGPGSFCPRQEQNPIWRKLQQISHSPFSARIERAKFPARFVTPPLAVYDGKSDPVGHLSRFRQSMAIHNNNDALMCRVFPSSLGEVGLRWFDRLEHGSIRSWKEMSKIFTARFITNTRKPKEIDSLLALTMKAGETLKSYSTRYWEVYNDIDACDEDIVVKTFRFGLHEDSKLRKSFTKRPPLSMAELMTRLEEHIRVEDDPKSRAKTAEVAPLVDRKAAQPEPRGESRRARKTKGSAGTSGPGVCPGRVHNFQGTDLSAPPPHQGQALLRMASEAARYHLEHLVKNGHLKQYVDETKSPHQNVEVPRINVKASAPIGIIDVIHFGTTCHDQRGEMRRAAHLREVFQVQDSPQMAPTPLRKESVEEIVFNNQDLEGVQLPHSDALVITLRIGEFDVKRVLIDPGSSVEIMYESLFKGLGLGKEDLSRRYDAILGRPWLHRMGAVPSTLHQRLRFPKVTITARYHGNLGGIMQSWEDNWRQSKRLIGSQHRKVSWKSRGGQNWQRDCLVASQAEGDQLPQGAKEGPRPQRQFLIGDSLTQEHKSQLLTLLNKYQDVFAWTPYEAPGVDPEFVCHELNVSPEYKPVVQKARRTAPQHAEAVREEVERLLKIGAIPGSSVPAMAVQHCRREEEERKMEDQLVDSTAGHERMSFLDAFQGYHQIALRKEDQEKTAFTHAPRGFLLQGNALRIEERWSNLPRGWSHEDVISELLGRTVEVYIDSQQHEGTILKLNASKCAFGVGSGKFLGFLVTQRGIEANPDQIAAIQGLQPPKNVREVQKLTGMAAALITDSSRLGVYDVRYQPRTAIKGQARYLLGELRKWREELLQAVRLGFSASNNEAEYEALLYGLRAAKRLGADPLTIHCDSQLIVNQLTGEYMAKDERMVAYLDLARNLLKGFCKYNIERVGREHNGHADSLAGQIASSVFKFNGAGVQKNHNCRSTGDTKHSEGRPGRPDQKEAAKIRKTATRYWVSREGKLYKRSYTGPYLLCVHPDLVPNLLYEIHEGICGSHTGGRSLAHRAIGQGYWWPYMQKDAAQYPLAICAVGAGPRRTATYLAPEQRAVGNRQWLIVATDYFTKWVEAEPLARITDSESRKFVWKNIITRFGIPRNHFSSPAYPQGNGQAESSNKVILSGIKKKLEEAKGRWVEELPTVLWTFRTTPRSSTGETPYSLTYGVEAVIPLEVGLPTLRSEEYDQDNNELVLAKDLDLAQERRDLAMIRLASYQGDLKKRYGKSVRERILAPGDLVLRKVLGSKRDPTQGKLGANWEGPYQIVSEAGLGAFNLQGMDGKPLKRPWNISNLKKFYQ
uniref:RNase H type-1 domain-containing protein n=1 Tax=Fagus sylvatica TaxID=28930 RepID=A0A2N9G132_FAGSY